MSKDYFKILEGVFSKTKVSYEKGKPVSLGAAVARVINLIIRQKNKGNKIIFIGNGGSASIASNIATDFLKNALIPAIAFNDASLITCISNDLGFEHVFQQPIEILSRRGDILFSISSSGKSKNILNASKAAKKKGLFLVTLSGFSKGNPLRKLGNINFYVPSFSYGYVEIIHMAICHNIVDKIMRG
jgi:D-sedoheptulose 7-phosphate isomerase